MTTTENDHKPAPSFKAMQRDGIIKRADAMKVRYEDIHVEPGFNLRDETEDFEQSCEELADYIAGGGIYPPLEVRPRAEGGVWIVDGHRRHRSIGIADKRGAIPRDEEGNLWISIVAFSGNDIDRAARIITSAEGRPLSMLELARGAKRLKSFGLSNADIGKKINKTGTTVENLLILAGANGDVHALVQEGVVSATTAIQTVRQKGEKAGAYLASLRDAKVAKSNGAKKAKVTNKTINGRSITQEEAKGLLRGIDQMFRHLPDDSREALAQARVLNDGKASITVPAWVILSLDDLRGTVRDNV